MKYDLIITLIAVSVFLIIIQIFSFIVINKMVAQLGKLTKELNSAQLKYTENSTFSHKLKTCENCFFRQSFINEDINPDNLLLHRCRLNGRQVTSDNSCANFHLEPSVPKS
jgi:hypothetical protein